MIPLVQLHEIERLGMKKDVQTIFNGYMQLARLGNKDILVPLERLGEELNSQQQLELSDLYKSLGNYEKAAYWHSKAKEVEEFKFEDMLEDIQAKSSSSTDGTTVESSTVAATASISRPFFSSNPITRDQGATVVSGQNEHHHAF